MDEVVPLELGEMARDMLSFPRAGSAADVDAYAAGAGSAAVVSGPSAAAQATAGPAASSSISASGGGLGLPVTWHSFDGYHEMADEAPDWLQAFLVQVLALKE